MAPQPKPMERVISTAINGKTPGGREVEVRDVSGMKRHEPPPLPEGLGERGSLEWKKIWVAGPWLWLDQDYFWVEQICRALDEVAAFRAEIAIMGLTVEGYNGQTVANPLIAEVRRANAEINKCLSMIGFSPADRARLKLADLKSEKLAKDLLNGDTSGSGQAGAQEPVQGYIEDSW